MTTWKWFDPAVDTEEAAKQKRKRYARQYHPDIAKDDGRMMTEINTEFEALVLYLNTPQPIPFTIPGSTPVSFWAAVVGSAKVNAGGGRVPSTGQQAPPPQPQPRPQYRAAPVPPPSAPPPTTYTAAPPPPPRPAAAPFSPPPPPSPAPAQRTRRAATRVPRGTNIAALEQQDYEQALLQPLNNQNLRVWNRVGIIWQQTNTAGDLVVVNDIRVGTYRLQIRVNGEVKEEFPLTRAWSRERAAAISHARNQYL